MKPLISVQGVAESWAQASGCSGKAALNVNLLLMLGLSSVKTLGRVCQPSFPALERLKTTMLVSLGVLEPGQGKVTLVSQPPCASQT